MTRTNQRTINRCSCQHQVLTCDEDYEGILDDYSFKDAWRDSELVGGRIGKCQSQSASRARVSIVNEYNYGT